MRDAEIWSSRALFRRERSRGLTIFRPGRFKLECRDQVKMKSLALKLVVIFSVMLAVPAFGSQRQTSLVLTVMIRSE